MRAEIGDLKLAAAAEQLPVYCPEAAVVKQSIEQLLKEACRPFSYKGPDISALYFNRFVDIANSHNIDIKGKRVIDFGCGQARPIGLAILNYLAGAENVLALDVREISDQGGVAIAAASTIISVMFGALSFDYAKVGGTWDLVRERAAKFDLSRLLKNDLVGGIPDEIWLKQALFEDIVPEERKFDIMVSNSVFEHLRDIRGCLRLFREGISEDGIIYAAIDYKDHRIYAPGNNFSMWQYLMDRDDDNGDINCIRHSTMLDILSQSGFEVLESRLETAVPSERERALFLPEFAGMSESDIITVAAHVLFRAKKTTQYSIKF